VQVRVVLTHYHFLGTPDALTDAAMYDLLHEISLDRNAKLVDSIQSSGLDQFGARLRLCSECELRCPGIINCRVRLPQSDSEIGHLHPVPPVFPIGRAAPRMSEPVWIAIG